MARPVTGIEFQTFMDVLGPFEAEPEIAIAVSGGGDSLALILLADDWAKSTGGKVWALTVDHGLREGARGEAEQVGRWLKAKGIAHSILSWEGEKPKTGIQEAARDARYRLMEGWCERKGILHLLLAHQREDQAETLLMRLQKGSGVTGLAGMSAVLEKPFCRLLRPLLAVPGDRLRATLNDRGQPWIEDPSNTNPRFARVRLRNAQSSLTKAGFTPQNLAEAATDMAKVRVAVEDSVALLLARSCLIHPAGFAELDSKFLLVAPEELRSRALRRVLRTIGGGKYEPHREKVSAILSEIVDTEICFKGRSLAGCRLSWAGGKLLICHEARGDGDVQMLENNEEIIWDRRFHISLSGDFTSPIRVQNLGKKALQMVISNCDQGQGAMIPKEALASLPAFSDEEGVFAVPHLNYNSRIRSVSEFTVRSLRFLPPNAVSDAGFSLAPGSSGTIF